MVENIEHLFYTFTIIIIFLYHKTYSKNNFFNYNIKNKFLVVVSFLMLILFIVFGNIKKGDVYDRVRNSKIFKRTR